MQASQSSTALPGKPASLLSVMFGTHMLPVMWENVYLWVSHDSRLPFFPSDIYLYFQSLSLVLKQYICGIRVWIAITGLAKVPLAVSSCRGPCSWTGIQQGKGKIWGKEGKQ